MYDEDTALEENPRVGRCSACEYSPVAYDARTCPRCGLKNPNPGLGNRIVGRGVLLGATVGAMIGLVAGAVTHKDPMTGSFAGGILGLVPGAFLGLILSLVVAFFAWLGGRR
jgi:hypothetical protein